MVAERVTHDVEAAERVFARLPALGIPLSKRIDELEAEGVTAFVKSWDALVAALEGRVREIAARR
jgi:transaldolase